MLFPFPRGTQSRVVAFVAVLYSLNIRNTETSNMFLNKHYEIPFVKECVARFPLPYSDNDRHRLHSVTRDVLLMPPTVLSIDGYLLVTVLSVLYRWQMAHLGSFQISKSTLHSSSALSHCHYLRYRPLSP